jgi:hypothetical protein
VLFAVLLTPKVPSAVVAALGTWTIVVVRGPRW